MYWTLLMLDVVGYFSFSFRVGFDIIYVGRLVALMLSNLMY